MGELTFRIRDAVPDFPVPAYREKRKKPKAGKSKPAVAEKRTGGEETESPATGTRAQDSRQTPTVTITGQPVPAALKERDRSDGVAPWVMAGTQLQVCTDASVRKTIEVRLGIDFGTAYTKLAIRVGRNIYIVDWLGVARPEEPHLLPSVIGIHRDGDYYVTADGSASSLARYLKRPFIEPGKPTEEERRNAAAYLAWVMRYARAWVFHHLRSSVSDRKIIWQVNIGIPTGAWSDQWERADSLVHIAKAGWSCSQAPSISVSEASQRLHSHGATTVAQEIDINLVPEVAAQVAGYRQSPERQNGMHLLVDVGAGTLDIAIFRLMFNADTQNDRIPVFATDVSPLGTNALMTQLNNRAAGRVTWNPAMRIPAMKALVEELGLSEAAVAEIEHQIAAKVADQVAGVLTDGRRADPTALEFRFDTRDPIRVFLSGGGSRVPAYKSGIQQGVNRHRHVLRAIPRYSDVQALHDMRDDVFDRVSVAVGLTYPAEDIELFRPRDIPPMSPLVATSNRPDRDELYPK
jgi:hypothetical protein